MPQFNFFQIPFVFLASSFALGMFFSYQSEVFVLVSLLLFSVPITLAFLKRKGVTLSFVLASFLFLGGFVQFFLNEEENILSKYQYRQVSVVVTVDEIASESKLWRKSLCTIDQLIVGEKKFQPNNQVLLYFSDDNVKLGDQLMVSTRLQEIENKGNPGEFDAKTYWNNKGISFMGFVGEESYVFLKYFTPSKLQLWRANILLGIENQLKKATQNNPHSYGVARALILGDKSELNPAVKESFQSAGAMHVLAVSGLHIGILLTVLIAFFRQFSRWINRTKATFFALAIIWCYAFLINFPPSVVRASLMFSIVFIGSLTNARQNGLNTLGVAFFVMLMIQPRWLFDLGFQLSFLAMLGIYTLHPLISKIFYIKNKWISKIWEGTSVGISAQLFTFPLTLYYFHQFPNYFILTNIGMMVFAFVVLILGFSVLAFQWIPGIKTVIAVLFSFSIGLMVLFVEKISSLPGAIATGFNINGGIVLILYLLLISFLVLRKSKKMLRWLALGFVGVFLWIQFGRFNQLTKNELVVFNADFPVFSIKKGRTITVFYPENKFEKTERILSGYKVLSGSSIDFIPTNFSHAKLSEGIKIQKTKGGFLVLLNQKRYFFRTKLMEDTPSDCFILDFSKNKLSDSNYSLEKAFVKTF